MRYFLELSYLGTAYHGWQRQTNAPSVQQTLEDALSKFLGENVELVGAGRTDTGVHAAHYVAHFDVDRPLGYCKGEDFGEGSGEAEKAAFANLLYHAGSMLPPDIALKGIRRVSDDAHARFDALEREYTYYILTRKDPFHIDTAWQYTVPLNLEAMNRAAAYLLDATDFTSFAKLGSDNKTNLCRVTEARWGTIETLGLPFFAFAPEEKLLPEAKEVPSAFPRDVARHIKAREENLYPDVLMFRIRADRFLRNMVRAIVGTLVDVGRGKITPERFAEIVAARDLSLSSGGAPAKGLFLTDIKYK